MPFLIPKGSYIFLKLNEDSTRKRSENDGSSVTHKEKRGNLQFRKIQGKYIISRVFLKPDNVIQKRPMCQPKMQFWKPLMGFWQTRLSFVMADSMSWLGAVACQFRDNKRDDINGYWWDGCRQGKKTWDHRFHVKTWVLC